MEGVNAGLLVMGVLELAYGGGWCFRVVAGVVPWRCGQTLEGEGERECVSCL